MKRKFLCLLLLTGILPLAFLSGGCTSSSCEKLHESINKCTIQWVGKYGRKAKKTCTLGEKKQQCNASELCIQPPGVAFPSCYEPGNVYKEQRIILNNVRQLCDPIFKSRQAAYIRCIEASECDVKKFNACAAKMTNQIKKEKEKGPGGALISFIIFLVITILVEGLLVFVGVKIVDRNNPKNTIPRGLVLGAVIAVVTFPLVYFSPLAGVLVSSSLLFRLIILFYQQEAFLPSIFTAIHIVFVWSVFTFLVAGEFMGGKAWLVQSAAFRRAMQTRHGKMAEARQEFEKEQRKLALERKRAAELKKQQEEEKRRQEKEKKEKEKEKEKK